MCSEIFINLIHMHEYDHLLTTVSEYLYCNILCPLTLNMTSSDYFKKPI